jgi:putative transposase
MKPPDNCRGGALPRPPVGASAPQRQYTRLPGYDYATPGAYYVTICTEGRRCVFGEVVEDGVVLSSAGSIVREIWATLPDLVDGITLDHFVIMPNHLHALLALGDRAAPLPRVIGTFKSLSTKSVNRSKGTPGAALWQRSYHDHVVRDEADLARIREYIANNPLKWHLDRENPAHVRRAAGRAEPGPYD